MKVINRWTCFAREVLLNSFFATFLKTLVLWATFKNGNMIHIRSQDDFRSRFKRYFFMFLRLYISEDVLISFHNFFYKYDFSSI